MIIYNYFKKQGNVFALYADRLTSMQKKLTGSRG